MRGPKPKYPRPVRLNLCLPEDVLVRVRGHLHRVYRGPIPKGAYQEFFEQLIRERLG